MSAIQGRKKGGGRAPTEGANTLRSTQIAEVQLLISEGEAQGLVNGLKSVYLDGVPLQNQNGSFNFEGVDFAYFPGTQGQPALPGLATVQNEVAVAVQVDQATPVTRTITDADVDHVRVTISVPQLTLQDTTTGDLKGSEFEFTVEIQANGAGYVERHRETIKGKTTGVYNKAVRIELSGAAPWDVRVKRISADPASANIVNRFLWASYTEIVSVKLRYPNSAVAALRVGAESFNRLPTVAFDWLGQRIKVPSNYNPLTRVYTGVWNGLFTTAWSNNPAWVLYDLVTQPRYGLGQFVPAALLNKWTLYAIGQYCDAAVANGRGGTEPRFTVNLSLETRAEAYNVLQDLAAVFRGLVFWASGAVEFVQDAPSDASHLFAPANVVDGLFTYSDTSEKTKHSMFVCWWSDLAQFGKRVPEIYIDESLVARYGVRELELQPLGITSRGQAARVCRWARHSEQLEGEVVTFEVGSDGVAAGLGQIFKIADPSEAGERLGGRIKAATTAAITLDAPVTLAAGEAYTLSVLQPDPVNATALLTETRAVTNAAGAHSVLNLASALTAAPVAGSVWVLESTGIAATTWRCIAVEEVPGANRFRVTGVAHNPSKFAAIEQGLKLDSRPISRLRLSPPRPASLAASETTYRIGHVTRSRVTVSWPEPAKGLMYALAWRLNGGAWVNLPQQSNNSADIDGLAAGPLELMLRSANGLGNTSLPVSASITVIGAGNLAATLGGKNLLSNSGLSQDSNGNGVADGWAVYNNAAVSATQSIVAGRRLGFNAQRVTFNAASTESHGAYTSASLVEAGVAGGVLGGWRAEESCVVSFYARKLNGAGFTTVYLAWNTAPAEQATLAAPVLSGVYQRYAFRLRWGAAIEAGGNLFISRAGLSAAGDAIDICDAQVEEGELLTAYAPRTDELLRSVLVDGMSVGAIATAATNFNTSNDRNAAAVPAPTLFTDGTGIDHTLQTDGSADISFEWLYASPEGNIDGFVVTVYQSASAAAYTMGTTPAAETAYVLPASKRAFILFGTSADQYYTVGVRAYRKVDADIAAQGILQSAIAQSVVAGENPYRPSASVAFAGNVVGTVNSIPAANVNVWAAIGGAGRPADNATVGAVAGTNLLDSNGRQTSDARLLGNLLDAGTWVLGSTGTQPGFNSIGGSEDTIVIATAPDNTHRALWRATSSDGVTPGDADGGWDTPAFKIDSTKQYRFSVWVRPSGTMDGSFYLGVGGSTVNDIGGGVNANPYFHNPGRSTLVSGRWYLLTGFVMPAAYAGAQLNLGGIYDGVTGERVANGTDYRWVAAQATSGHRAYQYYSSVGAVQDFFDPRVEQCNGSELSIMELIKVAGTSHLGLGAATDVFTVENAAAVGLSNSVAVDILGNSICYQDVGPYTFDVRVLCSASSRFDLTSDGSNVMSGGMRINARPIPEVAAAPSVYVTALQWFGLCPVGASGVVASGAIVAEFLLPAGTDARAHLVCQKSDHVNPYGSATANDSILRVDVVKR